MTKLQDFDFNLPPELIAQNPAAKRDQSNLLVPEDDNYHITKFCNIVDFLKPNDLLVFNNSRVINANLQLDKININLNKPIGENKWLAFAKPAKKLQIGDVFPFDQHQIIVTNKLANGQVELEFCLDKQDIFTFLAHYGQVPIPPYLKRAATIDDLERYQNIYSKPLGSVAAPTAGLHFSQELFAQLAAKNVATEFITLHVGAGTFLPVKTENITEHQMHSEYCTISTAAAAKIMHHKQHQGRVIAVGTTSLRALESCCVNGVLSAQSKETDIFITPGYKFNLVDALVTNFHLPKSTLFMLVCAFFGFQETHNMYNAAIHAKMRFFSYGDAMLINRKNV